MIAIGLLFVRMLCDCFRSRRQLEAEILVLRHQLNVLRQRAPVAALAPRAARPRAAEERDELAPFQLIELHSIPAGHDRIVGYRIDQDQSGGIWRGW
jgi:hypothetical protein